jgi:hypothetical protein
MFKSRTFIITAIAVGIVVINLIIFAAGPFVGASSSAPGFGDLQAYEANGLSAPAYSLIVPQTTSVWDIFFHHPLASGDLGIR